MQKQIKKILTSLDVILKWGAKTCIRLYQYTLSPDKSVFFRFWLRGRVCRHYPHCSQYGYECFDRYSFFTACYRTMDRISRCTPGLGKSYDPVAYRVVFASGSPIGVSFLQALHDDPRYEVVGVLTMPDMPSGRGMKLQENVISVTAQKFVIQPVVEESFIDNHKRSLDKLEMTKDQFIKKPHSLRLDSKKYSQDAKETYERLQSLDIDILYVVAYGYIIPQYILDLPKIAPINIHGSLLPAYRGASPLQTVFLDGLRETGITLMKMEAGLDSGPMIDKQIVKLGFSDTVADLIQKIKDNTARRSLDALDEYCHGNREEQIQDESQVTYCGKIEKKDGLVHHTDSLDLVRRKYKAYALWPKIFFIVAEKSIIIEYLEIDEQLFSDYKDISLFNKDMNYNPAILAITVKPEGSKSMSREDFKRGYL